MKIQPPNWSGMTRSVGIGITALALIVTFSLPNAALAKEKAATAKISKQKSVKTAKTTLKVKTKTKASKPAKKRLLSKKHQRISHSKAQDAAPLVRKASHESRQAYYIMPDTLGGKVATPQLQPSYLQVSAIKHPAKASPTTPNTDATATPHQVGTASYYSDKFHGRKTASGERFDQNDLTCAHGSLPFGCRIRVTNLHNNKSVEVKVNDRGGFHKHGRVLDLSKAAAKEIGMINSGTAKVKIEVLE